MKIHITKCDFCGKDLDEIEDRQGLGLHYRRVGYGSQYDECEINIDLCCDCFDKMMKEYVEPKLKFKEEAIKNYY